MITNVKTSLTDDQRAVLYAALNDGKKGVVSRKDVTAFILDCLEGAVEASESISDIEATSPPVRGDMSRSEMLRSTHGDPALEGKSLGYIIGWNKVKFKVKV